MTDASVPVGDRNPPSPVTGPALARQALADAPRHDFTSQVVEAAQRAGWAYFGTAGGDPGHPHYVFLRGGRLLAVWVSSAPIGFKGGQWRGRLHRAGVETHVLSPRGGIGLAEALFAEADKLGSGEVPSSWCEQGPPPVDECGQPGPLDRDGGRRGD